MTEFGEKLSTLCAPFWRLTDSQLATLEEHYRLMLRWNRVLNLTRVAALDAAVQKHYGESIFLAAQLPAGLLRLADVGSGPGFPGLPVGVLRPECQVFLIESHQRKAAFLKEASRGLRNVAVLARRAEDVTERFDWVISRAVRPGDVVKLKLAEHHALLVSRGTIASGDERLLPWGADSVVVLL